MFICIECDEIKDMSMFEEPQCFKCGSTMYSINPVKKGDNSGDNSGDNPVENPVDNSGDNSGENFYGT